MYDNARYVNSIGKEIIFGQNNIILNENDLRNYEWTFEEYFNKITNLRRAITKKTIPIIIYGENASEIKNNLFEITEVDVITNTQGTLYIGNYYMKGFFVSSAKAGYTKDSDTKYVLTFVSDYAFWLTETKFIYRYTNTTESGFDFPYDYPYDYGSPFNTESFVNSAYVPSNFRMIMYGPITNPIVTIGTQIYKLNIVLSANEYVTIDSMQKTIIKTSSNGTETNQFSTGDKANYIFKKLPTGTNNFTTSDDFNVDLVVIDERSEPKWT